MFTLKFSTDNAAFEEFPYAEVVRILRHVAEQVDELDTEGIIRDSNGNTIGKWRLT